MKKFKKAVSSVTLAAVLFMGLGGIRTPEANAGVILIAAAPNTGDYGMDGLGQTLGGLAVCLLGIGVGITGLATGSLTAGIVGGGILVLNADGSLPQDALSESLSTKYPFIDNTDVTHRLAAKIGSNFVAQNAGGNPRALVSVSPADTRTALADAGLTPEQENQVVNDLE